MLLPGKRKAAANLDFALDLLGRLGKLRHRQEIGLEHRHRGHVGVQVGLEFLDIIERPDAIHAGGAPGMDLEVGEPSASCQPTSGLIISPVSVL